jgi:hypothetical protein
MLLFLTVQDIVYFGMMKHILGKIKSGGSMESNQLESKKLRIKSVKSLGVRPVYDIEMAKNHNFVLQNGVVAHNCSHAAAYSLTGYVCAWLKHNYPTEWWTSVLKNADRKKIETKFWKYCNGLILSPDIQMSGDNFEIQNGRIRAPLRLLNGVGETAHEELMSLRPFSTVKEFCEKSMARRVKNGITVTKIKETKKAGKQEIQVLKLGRSNLNSTLMTKLIASGTCDSLFPPDMKDDLYRKLSYYTEVKADTEHKKPKPIDPRFVGLNPLQIYQLRKDVLSSYSEELVVPYAKEMLPAEEFRVEGCDPSRAAWKMPRKFDENDWCPIVNGSVALKLLDKENPRNDISPKFKFGVVGYVLGFKSFWSNKAHRISFEVNGEIFEAVKWPNQLEKKNGVGASLPKDLKGSVCVLTLSRWSSDKEFSIDDIRMIQGGLSMKKTEESDD